MMLAAFSLASCKPSAQQTVADAEQPTDSTEAVTSADALRLVITDKHLMQTDSLIGRTLRLPLDSIHVEPDKYDFERGQIYRIVKEFFKKGKRLQQSVYCYFSFE